MPSPKILWLVVAAVFLWLVPNAFAYWAYCQVNCCEGLGEPECGESVVSSASCWLDGGECHCTCDTTTYNNMPNCSGPNCPGAPDCFSACLGGTQFYSKGEGDFVYYCAKSKIASCYCPDWTSWYCMGGNCEEFGNACFPNSYGNYSACMANCSGHTVCLNDSCVIVPGLGKSECLGDADCAGRSFCQNNSCVWEPEPGENKSHSQ